MGPGGGNQIGIERYTVGFTYMQKPWDGSLGALRRRSLRWFYQILDHHIGADVLKNQ